MRRAQRHNHLKLGFTKKNWIQPRQFFLSKKHRIILHSQTRTPYVHSCSVVLGLVEPAWLWESPFPEVRNRKGTESGLAWPTPHCALFQCFYPAFYSSCINNEFKNRTISESWLSFVPHERKSVDKFHISQEYTSWASRVQYLLPILIQLRHCVCHP